MKNNSFLANMKNEFKAEVAGSKLNKKEQAVICSEISGEMGMNEGHYGKIDSAEEERQKMRVLHNMLYTDLAYSL